MTKEIIKEKLTSLFFSDEFIDKLIIKMIKEGDTWFGGFNPPFTNKERINQFLGQSAFIRFGDTLETILNEIIIENGYKQLTRKIQSNNYESKKDKKLDYDVIVSKDKIGYVAEVKVRDNHDSTKKTGQAEDLERKIIVASQEYPNLSFSGIAFYIDKNIKKNGAGVVELINDRNAFKVFLAYGKDFFDILGIDKSQWIAFEQAVADWSLEKQPMMSGYSDKIKENADRIKSEVLQKYTVNKISETLKDKLLLVIEEYRKLP